MIGMRRIPRWAILGLLFAVGAVAASVALFHGNLGLGRPHDATASERFHRPAGMTKIKHVVFIIKENRTFENYFGTFSGADGATAGMISTGETVALGRTPDRTPHDIGHSFQNALTAINGGLMNQFDLIPGGNVNGQLLAYTQLAEDDIPNYFAYARSFVLADGEQDPRDRGGADTELRPAGAEPSPDHPEARLHHGGAGPP